MEINTCLFPTPHLPPAAQFTVTVRYETGATTPTGNVNFNYKPVSGNRPDFHFRSAGFDWLIVSGSRIQIRGLGTINNGPTLYRFTLTALDAGARNSGADKLRLLVTSMDGATLVFDNHEQVGLGMVVVKARCHAHIQGPVRHSAVRTGR